MTTVWVSSSGTVFSLFFRAIFTVKAQAANSFVFSFVFSPSICQPIIICYCIEILTLFESMSIKTYNLYTENKLIEVLPCVCVRACLCV